MEISGEFNPTAVTVYPDRARVVLRGSVEVPEGEHQIVVDDLPLTLHGDSLRARGRGSAAVQIRGVDLQRRHYDAAPAEQVVALEREIEAVEEAAQVQQDRKAGLAARQTYLDGMRQATDEYARGIARGKTGVAAQLELLSFLQEEDTAVRAGIRQAEAELRELGRRLDRLRRELKELHSQRPRQRLVALVDVDVQQGGELEAELSYVVNQAGWRPLYDVQLNFDAAGTPDLALTMLAEVFQRTGQPWAEVTLTLSTARPSLNQRLPELHPWYIDAWQPEPRPVRAQMARAQPEGAAMAATTALEAPAPQADMKEATVQTAVADVSETAVHWQIESPRTIPSDGSTHKATLGAYRLEPRLEYVTVPRHTTAVFRRVAFDNTTPAPLLPGQVALIAGDEFIGRTAVELTPRGDEVTLLLGAEDNITVEREVVKRDVDKRLLRDRRQIRYGYELRLHNVLDRDVTVKVCDQIPVARHEEITVKLNEVEPEPAERSDLNLLEWQLRLAPEERQTIRYEYTVEHPRSLRVAGLVD